MHVIGTAGHVDHGKSALVEALTGIHPDRLKEEKERQMTIDLGFAWLTMPGGEEIGIVDVPGHRDFIENMLSGVAGLDAVILVVAADEGIMPQTREHLAILDLLQIQTGIVALTKIDLVDDPDWLHLVEEDIQKIIDKTVLKNAPIQKVSSKTGAGVNELLNAIRTLMKNLPERPDLGRPRLPVDRVFSISGFGTVVTGTLSDGKLAIGEEVEILPSGQRGRIRGLQTHKKNERMAVSGSRTAVNISGLDVNQIQRGEVVTHPGQYLPTQRLDLSLRLLSDVSTPLRHHTEVKLFIGTSESIANLRLLGTDSLNPGENGWVQLDLRKPVVCMRGDRYILRRPSPGETLGGGSVLDPLPKRRHKRFDQNLLNKLDILAKGTPSQVILEASRSLGPAPVKNVISQSQIDGIMAESSLQELLLSNQLVLLDEAPLTLDSVILAAARWTELKETTTSILSAYHGSYPLRHGMPREELKNHLNLAPRLFNLVLQKMKAEGILAESPKWVAITAHKVGFSPFQQVKVDRLLSMFTASPFAPPSVKESQAEVGADIFNVLRESGDLVVVSNEVVFLNSDYELMVKRIREYILEKGKISLAESRNLFNTSRKYMQALLEHLDVIGVTERDGDTRNLKK